MTRTTLARRAAIGSTLLALALVAAPGGAAARDGDVIQRGDCTGASTWKLELSLEDGRIEVEGEVDQNRNGVTWNWRMERNGVRFARGQTTTQPPSGSFEVRRLTTNGEGPDRIVFRAVNPATGEVCRGVATI